MDCTHFRKIHFIGTTELQLATNVMYVSQILLKYAIPTKFENSFCIPALENFLYILLPTISVEKTKINTHKTC